MMGHCGLCIQHARAFHSTTRALQSTPSTAAEVAQAFLSKFRDRPPQIRRQLIDANQLQLFSLTLHRPQLYNPASTPHLIKERARPGTPVPPYYHLAYFTAPFLESELGLDGTDKSYNPDPPFTRRMWAGGSVSWPGANPKLRERNYLRVGEEVMEETKVVSCEPKVIRKTGAPMLVVGIEKTFSNEHGIAVVDRRQWAFREALDPENPPKMVPKPPVRSEHELPQGNNVRRFCQTPVTLFRFSALTFNGHKIHYSEPWCRDVEGHRGLVVHGPMNMINMLDLWRDLRGGGEDVVPKELRYRATSPVYAGEGYRVVIDASSEGENAAGCRVVSDDGTVCMKGEIEEWSDKKIMTREVDAFSGEFSYGRQ